MLLSYSVYAVYVYRAAHVLGLRIMSTEIINTMMMMIEICKKNFNLVFVILSTATNISVKIYKLSLF